jgi:exonuclease SbcC
MRLHRLEMQGFGPFADPQVVDFDRLNASGLFLLEGRTGAGKSSVLDALTFALYGDVATDGGRDRARSSFVDATEPTTVDLIWSLRGQRYRVRRSPAHERPAKRGGTTVIRPTATLWCWQDGGWQAVADKPQDVGPAVQELLGLNRRQFTKVVLLPQGACAGFLQAKPEERRPILSSLFGGESYAEVEQLVQEWRRAAEADVAAALTRRDVAAAAALEAAGRGAGPSDDAAPPASAAPAPQRWSVVVSAIAEELASELARTRVESGAAERTLHAATELADAVAAHADAAQRQRRAVRALADHVAGEAAHQQRRAQLAGAQAAAAFGPLLAEVTELAQQVADAQGTVSTLLDAPTDAQLRGHGAADHRAQASAADQEVGRLEPVVELECTLPDRQQELVAAAHAVSVAAAAEQAAMQCQQRLPEAVEAAEGQCRTLERDAASLEALLAEERRVQALRTAAADVARLRPAVASARQALDQAQQRSLRAVTRHRDLLRQRLDGMASEMASRLRDGEPCGVCGSLDHPAPAVRAEQVPSFTQLLDAERTADAAAQDERAAAEALAGAAAGLQRAEGALGDADVAALEAQATAIADRLALARRAVERLPAAREQLAALSQRQAEAGDAVLAAAARRVQAEAVLAELQRAVDAAVATVVAERGDDATAADRRARQQRTALHHRAVAVALDRLAEALHQLATCRERAEGAAAAAGFASLDDAQHAALDPEGVQALQAQVQAWETAREVLAVTVTDGEAAGFKADTIEQVAEDRAAQAHALRTEAAQASVRADHVRQQVALLEHQVARFEIRAAEVVAAEGALDAAEQAAAPLRRLDDLLRGVAGHPRMTLQTYVLRLWFERVLQAANGRLHAMSAGRYSLVRTEGAERATDKVGLGVEVLDHCTGRRRSPLTLSGGETFYASLALALGLADVVRGEAGAAELDTVFVDEGFGSLDQDTLQDVLGVVDELRGNGRVVGLVSHVDLLKEQIADRIEVIRPVDAGPSTLRVVA